MAQKPHQIVAAWHGRADFGQIARLAALRVAAGDSPEAVRAAVAAAFGPAPAPKATLRDTPAPLQLYGELGIDFDDGPVEQIRTALRLPIAVRGVLAPDAHLGYGLPIGGVFAAQGAVAPFMVGVDIGCRVHCSLFAMPPADFRHDRAALFADLCAVTVFGAGQRGEQTAVVDHCAGARADHGPDSAAPQPTFDSQSGCTSGPTPSRLLYGPYSAGVFTVSRASVISARSARLTASAVGNAAATSGASTTTFVPSAYRWAYLPWIPVLKSYSAAISGSAISGSAVLCCVSLIGFPFSGGCPPRTDNPNGSAAIGMHDNYEALLERQAHDDQPIFGLCMRFVIARERQRIPKDRAGLFKGDAMLVEIGAGLVGSHAKRNPIQRSMSRAS